MRRGSVSPCDSPTARQSRFRGVRWLGAPLLRLPQVTRMTRATRSAMKGPNRRPRRGPCSAPLEFSGNPSDGHSLPADSAVRGAGAVDSGRAVVGCLPRPVRESGPRGGANSPGRLTCVNALSSRLQQTRMAIQRGARWIHQEQMLSSATPALRTTTTPWCGSFLSWPWIGGRLACWWASSSPASWPGLSYGLLRPLHTNEVIFAFGGCVLFASSYYVVQLTSQVRLFATPPAAFTFWGWQLVILAAAISLPLGYTSGKEYAELEWPIDILITLIWVSYAIVFFGTVGTRKVRHIYVANWFFGAFILAVALLHVVNSAAIPAGLMKSYSAYAGVQDAMVQW